MARLPRLTLAGQVHLALLRGRDGQSTFVDDEDRRRYGVALLEASRELALAVHAYVLLDHEVMLLVSPPEAVTLARFIQGVGRRYARVFNRRHGRRGALWDGRFRSTVLEPGAHLLECMRLIEQAPVRGGMVAQATEWPWSSALHHAGQRVDSIVTDHPAYWQLGNTPFERQARYVREGGAPLPGADVERILVAVQRGWPLGPASFLQALAELTDRPLQPRPRGRPRRSIETKAKAS